MSRWRALAARSGAAALSLVLLASLVLPAAAQGDAEVTVGSQDVFFSRNKQNEPAVAVNPINPSLVAAGANDNIDLELCNAGTPTTCPFTPGVGVSGVQFSTDGGASWTQPTYRGWTARHCLGAADPAVTDDPCQPAVGPIGTLPRYYESQLVSNGDPALAWGPRPGPGGFAWANGARLYYANIATPFPDQNREEFFKGQGAIAVSRTDDVAGAVAGNNNAWMPPVIATKQSSALFSDKEAIWADNAASSRFFGNVYVCNAAFRSMGGAPEPVVLSRSTDGGATWSTRQISQAANTGSGAGRSGGRQGCAVRTDSRGVLYVFWNGGQNRQDVQYLARSFDGGVRFERPRPVANVEPCGLFDPVQGRYTFDGIAGARTNSYPSADIANGAPTGADATDAVVLMWCDGPTPSSTATGPNEQALVQVSRDGGATWSAPVNAAPATDRPDFPAVAVSPDGRDVYATYMNFLQPWQTRADTPPRLMEGVVRHADMSAAGVLGAFADLHRGPRGDARGSSANGLTAEFLGDYNYVSATRAGAVAVWNDVREAADCPAIDAYRQSLADPAADLPPPRPNTDCPATFGNSDIWGAALADPTAP
jgi:hypothetical protein